MALRKNFVFLTATERTRLASALNAINASGFLANLASQHSTNFLSGIHWGSAFLPWHRWFLRVLEQELQIHEPGVMIPYWDWTRPDSRNIDVEPWKSFFGGRNNSGGQFDHWTYTRSATDGGSHLPELLPGGMGTSIVNRLAATTFAGFRAIESSGGHGGGHNWVGGTMAGGDSPRDPLFWLHHGNIDRLWAIWQRNNPTVSQYNLDPAPGNDSVPQAMVPLNSPMIGGATPSQMLDHTAPALGYTYDADVRLEGAWESTGRPHLTTGDPTSVDLYIRDNAADTGATPTAAPHWESPDIWVRNQPPGPTENPDDGHQAPIVNQPNHVYVLVHNRGAATNAAIAVEAYHCSPGTGMLWPTHFQSLGSLPVPSVPAGGQARVGPFIWTPTIAGHECLLAIARTETQDPGSLETAHGVTVPAGTAAALDHSLLVRFVNNVGQRNVAPVLALPGAKMNMGLTIRGLERTSTHSVSIDASRLPRDTRIEARLANGVLNEGSTDMTVARRDDRFTTLGMTGGSVKGLKHVPITANGSFVLRLGVDFSFEATHLKQYPIRIEQLHDEAVVGAYTVELTAIKDLEDYFFGNPRSGELHVNTCPLWPKMSTSRLQAFETVDDAVARGFNGCRFCLPEHDRG